MAEKWDFCLLKFEQAHFCNMMKVIESQVEIWKQNAS